MHNNHNNITCTNTIIYIIVFAEGVAVLLSDIQSQKVSLKSSEKCIVEDKWV